MIKIRAIVNKIWAKLYCRPNGFLVGTAMEKITQEKLNLFLSEVQRPS